MLGIRIVHISFVQIVGIYFSGAVIWCCVEMLMCGLNVTSLCVQKQK